MGQTIRGDVARDTIWPLTPLQKSFLFEVLGGAAPGTNVEQIVCRLGRPAHPDRLQSALRRVHARHAALRAVPDPERGVQVVSPEVEVEVELERAEARDEAGLEAFLAADRARPFAPARPPVRWTLVDTGRAEGGVLVWTVSHVLVDGRSFSSVLVDVLRAEAGEELHGEAVDPGPLYAWHAERSHEASLAWWKEKLQGFGGKPAFPSVLAPLGPQAGLTRGHTRTALDAGASDRLRARARELEVTVEAFVQAAWAIALSRLTLDEDVLFGAARAARQGTVPEARDAVGLAMNLVAVRADATGGRPVVELLRDLRGHALALRPHQQVPLFEVARGVGEGRAEIPFDTAVVFDRESLDARMARLRPSQPERFELREQTSFPLTLYAYDDPSLALELGYDRARVDDEAAEALLEQVRTLLAALPEQPEAPLAEVGMGSAEAAAKMAELAEGPPAAHTEPSPLPELLRRLEAEPEAVAVRFRDRHLTRGELDRASRAVARKLVDAGCRPGDLVGVYRERDLHLVSVLLGIWRAGAAYVPLDPSYPEHRIAFKLEDARLGFVVTTPETTSRLPPSSARIVELEGPLTEDAPRPEAEASVGGGDLAYLIYTSGSTGRPKGALVEHAQVAAFFAAMDAITEPERGGAWLAVTSLSFDISVLELLYTVSRGIELVVHDERDDLHAPPRPAISGGEVGSGAPRPKLGLMFFSGAEGEDTAKRYDFLFEAARRADAAGFEAVWTPERHFHAFGGPYPNPSVLGAALARETSRLSIRAGSVVLPLHHPARVAEEWAVIDNLSRGRVAVSFASGWHARDFALRPENHADRKRHLVEGIEIVRRLWRGEAVRFEGPEGEVEVRTLPRPVQPELPVWVTAAGNPATFEEAGRLGANVLTHLLGQKLEEVEEKIRRYRAARAAAGHAGPGCVTLMLHAFVGEDREAVRSLVREPMKAYLRTAFGLVRENAFDFPVVAKKVGGGADLDAAIAELSEAELDALHEHAFERYFETSGLFGTPEDAARALERAARAGADEVACLVDFGVPFDATLESVERLGALAPAPGLGFADDDFSLPALLARHEITHLQCTPSRARLLTLDPAARAGLAKLRRFLVGGEALPSDLAGEITSLVEGEVWNMYGPTETTVWSAAHRVRGTERSVPIGRPIAGTVMRVLDDSDRPAPIGVAGELAIGGAGVTRGYLRRNDLTARRFGVDPHAEDPRARIYRTGDIARWRADGRLEFLGRRDQQVKIRGYRIELGEIEEALRAHPGVEAAVVSAWRPDDGAPARLVAHVVPASGTPVDEAALRQHLQESLPSYMIPSRFAAMVALPLLPNGKLDRSALPDPSRASTLQASEAARTAAPTPAPAIEAGPDTADLSQSEGRPDSSGIEAEIEAVWKEVLGVDQVSRDQNFFDLGGHSLLVVQVHGRLKPAHPSLGITELFRFPTVSGLAGHLARQEGAAGSPSSSVGGETRARSRRSALARRREARRGR